MSLESNKLIYTHIYNNNVKEFKKLINKVNINEKNNEGYTLLIVAIKYSNNNAYIDILLKNGIDINITDNNKYTALSHAIIQNNCTLAINILKKHYKYSNYNNYLDINYQDKNGMTYVMLSCICIQNIKEKKKLVKILFDNGAVNDLRNNSGFTASYYVEDRELLKLIENNGKKKFTINKMFG